MKDTAGKEIFLGFTQLSNSMQAFTAFTERHIRVYFHSSFQAIPEFIPADHSCNSFRIQYNSQDRPLDQVVEWILLKDLSIYEVSDL